MKNLSRKRQIQLAVIVNAFFKSSWVHIWPRFAAEHAALSRGTERVVFMYCLLLLLSHYAPRALPERGPKPFKLSALKQKSPAPKAITRKRSRDPEGDFLRLQGIEPVTPWYIIVKKINSFASEIALIEANKSEIQRRKDATLITRIDTSEIEISDPLVVEDPFALSVSPIFGAKLFATGLQSFGSIEFNSLGRVVFESHKLADLWKETDQAAQRNRHGKDPCAAPPKEVVEQLWLYFEQTAGRQVIPFSGSRNFRKSLQKRMARRGKNRRLNRRVERKKRRIAA